MDVETEAEPEPADVPAAGVYLAVSVIELASLPNADEDAMQTARTQTNAVTDLKMVCFIDLTLRLLILASAKISVPMFGKITCS